MRWIPIGLVALGFFGCGPDSSPTSGSEGADTGGSSETGQSTTATTGTRTGTVSADSGQTDSGGATTEGDAGTGAGPTGTGADTGGASTGGVEGNIVCGVELCDGQTEFCLGCDHDGSLDVHCMPRSFETLFEEVESAFEHGCTSWALFIECDDPGDCDPGSACVFSSGENGYAFCTADPGFESGMACDGPEDCPAGAPSCAQYDPLEYFSPYADVLGWLPQACVP